MAAKPRLNKLKRQLDKLRRDSFSVVASANRIVTDGVQKLADKELKALNDYYHAALESIRNADKNDSIKGIAQQQLEMFQETANQVIANARESLAIIAEARTELTKLVQKSQEGAKVTEKQLEAAAEPAIKAVRKVRAAVEKAVSDVGNSAWDGAVSVKKTATTAAKRGRKAVETVIAEAEPVVAEVRAETVKVAKAASKSTRKAAKTIVEAVTEVVEPEAAPAKKTTRAASKAVRKAASKASKSAQTTAPAATKGAWKTAAVAVTKAPAVKRAKRAMKKASATIEAAVTPETSAE